MPDPVRSSAPRAEEAVATAADLDVGGFRFWFVGQRWEWSDELARMHGYEPGAVTPTTELVLSHKHPDDRRHVQELLGHANIATTQIYTHLTDDQIRNAFESAHPRA